MPHLVDIFVDAGILLDIGVRLGYVGFGLVVVVVTHEVFHRVAGKEILQLSIQLCRQCLVRGDNQGGFLAGRNDMGHGKGLSGAGHAQQDLVFKTLLYPS